jgi:hypothetical protein
MRVTFSDTALAGIMRDVEDWERQQSTYASLKWYLARDVPARATRHPGFPGRRMYVYAHGQTFRVLVEVRADELMVWSVRGVDGIVKPST